MTDWTQLIEEHTAWMIAAGRDPGTISKRRHYLVRAAETFPAGPGNVQTADLVAYAASRTWEPETRKQWKSTLATFYRWAVEFGRLRDNPAARLPAVKVPRGVPRPVPDDVFAAARAAASPRDDLIILLAAHAGLRRAEIASLRWLDVGSAALTVTGKGRRTRILPLLAELGTALSTERRRRDDGLMGEGWRYDVDPTSPYVFPGLKGGHMSVETIGAILKRSLGSGWSGHKLRHRYATRVYNGSHDLLATQQLLGHSRPETTQRYVAIAPDALLSAATFAA